jgi:hypothetical protein
MADKMPHLKSPTEILDDFAMTVLEADTTADYGTDAAVAAIKILALQAFANALAKSNSLAEAGDKYREIVKGW